MPRPKAAPAADVLAPSRPTLVLSPFTWRAELEHTLIEVGIGHDQAGLIARRVLNRLVERLRPELRAS